MESKPWHIDSQTKQTSLPSNHQKYGLLPANPSDIAKVQAAYTHHPVEGYGIAKVEVIFNPEFNRAFSLELSRLQEKAKSVAFDPKWGQMEDAEQRGEIMQAWETLTRPHTDQAYPQVRLLPAWHGTRPELLDSIFRVGYSNLSFTDDGYFGKGLYSAHEAEYSYRVYSRGALILNWVASYSALPVIDGDMKMLQGRGNYGNYDAHFVPVAPRNPDNPEETVYYPCRLGQTARYHEVVVFQTSACLPRYLVQLEATLLKSPGSGSMTVSSDYTQGVPVHFQLPSPSKNRPSEVSTVSSDYGANALPAAPPSVSGTELSPTSSSDYTVGQVVPRWQPSEEQRRRVVSEGQVALQSGRYAQALQRLEPLAEVSPEATPTATVLLGWLYEHAVYPSNETTQRQSQAYYAQAYAQKNRFLTEAPTAEAQYELGLLYTRCTQATDAERQQGRERLTAAAQQGHAGAQRELGLLYQTGQGVPANAETAVYCYQSAAKGGDVRAMYHLATCLAQGAGVAKNPSQALAWYQAAAEQGDALAQNNLGLCYEQGDGVPQDYVKAAHYYQLAAAQGYGLAQHNLGVIYENGRVGVAKDLVKAAQHYHGAAAQNLARAQNNLARFYENGLGGMPQDLTEAFRLYQAAAQQNYARAQYNLGVCYELGRGTTQDLNQAKQYYTLAAHANERISPDAKARLAQLAQRMPTPSTTTTPFWQPPGNASSATTPFQLPPNHRPF